MNNKLIYILIAIVVVYAVYYCYQVKKMEQFLTENFTDEPLTTNESTNSNINYEDAEHMLEQLEILKNNMSKTNKIVMNDFSEPNNFIPYVVNNFKKLNNIEKKNEKATQARYDQKISELKNKIKNFRYQLDLENGKDIKTVKSITSVESGQPISVLPVNHKNHVVIVNNQCLSADAVGSYDLKTCNYMDPKQHFNLNPIYHDIDYNIQLSPSSQKVNNSVDEGNLSVTYPFMMVKSESSGNCLGNADGNIFLKPCKAKSEYRWIPSTSLYQCKPQN